MICDKLGEYEFVDDGYFEKMVFEMKSKLIKYFKEMPPVFSIAAALNPTLNVTGVELLLEKISDNLGLWEEEPLITGRLKNDFNRQFHSLFMVYFEKYGSRASSSSSFFSTTQHRRAKDQNINLFNMVQEENTKRARGDGSSANNSEYGRYIGTNFVVNMEYEEYLSFDILEWWKSREAQYPILAAMARDVLCVQASTVASESAFSTSGRVLSIRRTRLTPDSLEMCICLKDHLDAVNRVQNTTSLEQDALDFEQDIHNEEVEDGDSLELSDEEIRMDEAMRVNLEEE